MHAGGGIAIAQSKPSGDCSLYVFASFSWWNIIPAASCDVTASNSTQEKPGSGPVFFFAPEQTSED